MLNPPDLSGEPFSLSAKDVKSVSLPAADVKCYQEEWSPISIELQPWIRLIKKKSPVNLAIYRTLLRRERDFIPLYQLP